jgi:uncharacterized protein
MERLQKLIPFVKPYYDQTNDPAHDWPHVGRVASLARKIAANETVSMPCLLAAVYCHDLINLPKDHPDRKKASTMTAEKSEGYLKKAGFHEFEVRLIQNAIIEHSFSKGLKPSSVEAAILQDADRLDALGAIGVLRCASVNTLMQSSYYEPMDPLAEKRPLDDKRFMIDHYFVKLFKLPALMNTSAGKIEAESRVEYMKDFLEQLMREIRS